MVVLAVLALSCFLGLAMVPGSRRDAPIGGNTLFPAHHPVASPSDLGIELNFNEDVIPPAIPTGNDANFLHSVLRGSLLESQVDVASLLAMPDSTPGDTIKTTGV
jgi:hypothetical protein